MLRAATVMLILPLICSVQSVAGGAELQVRVTVRDDSNLLGDDRRVSLLVGSESGIGFILTDRSGVGSTVIRIGDEDTQVRAISAPPVAEGLRIDEDIEGIAWERFDLVASRHHVPLYAGASIDRSRSWVAFEFEIRPGVTGTGSARTFEGQASSCSISVRRSGNNSINFDGEFTIPGLPKGAPGEIWIEMPLTGGYRIAGYTHEDARGPIDFGTIRMPSIPTDAALQLEIESGDEMRWSNGDGVVPGVSLLASDGMTIYAYPVGEDGELRHGPTGGTAMIDAGTYWIFPGLISPFPIEMFVLDGLRAGRSATYYGLSEIAVTAGKPVRGEVNLQEMVDGIEAAWRSRFDINGDETIDGSDLVTVITDWGPCPAPPEATLADLNLDGFVDGSDLRDLLSAWRSEGLAQEEGDALSALMARFGLRSIDDYVSWVESLSVDSRVLHARAISELVVQGE
ncbi:MAG: dockerin type I domain-containing protein [Planctomycetota bacterium]|nr:dockerin type I domain-containing protein [Planctomycetota bacterium]